MENRFKVASIFCLLIAGSTLYAECSESPSIKYLYSGNDLTFTHVTETSPIYKIHSRLSPEEHDSFKQAQAFYNEQNYLEAYVILDDLYQDHPDDLILLNHFARTSYKLYYYKKEDRSFELYQKLLQKLHEYGLEEVKGTARELDPAREYVVIFTDFTEAYWKIGTLYLDRKQYLEAYREISKILLYFQMTPGELDRNPVLKLQAYNYLTEATYFLKLNDANAYFYCQALKADPENHYAEKYKISE